MLPEILKYLNTHKQQVLQFAEMALPQSQFLAFRKKFLDEFGLRGFEAELVKVLADSQHTGKDRHGRA